jgi:hypothetical protein
MSDFIAGLASQTGISPEQAKKGIGALLSFLKQHLPADSAEKVVNAVPDSEGMMAAADLGAEKPSGGVLGAVAGAVGKLFGGGGAAAVLSKLSHLGLSAEQVKKFVAAAVELLRSKLPADVMKQVNHLLPAPEGEGS